MEQKLSLDQAKKKFTQLRTSVERIIARTPRRQLDEVFGEKFAEIFTDATLGDVVAQDYLGYIFKRGRNGLVPENIDLSMKWLILAAANGNPVSVERLAIFLNFVYDEIVYKDDFGLMAATNGITSENYTFIIGSLACQAIVDELKIDAREIIKQVPTTLRFNSTTMGIYDRARNNAIPIVLTYLRGKNPHEKQQQPLPPVEKPKKQKLFERRPNFGKRDPEAQEITAQETDTQ